MDNMRRKFDKVWTSGSGEYSRTETQTDTLITISPLAYRKRSNNHDVFRLSSSLNCHCLNDSIRPTSYLHRISDSFDVVLLQETWISRF